MAMTATALSCSNGALSGGFDLDVDPEFDLDLDGDWGVDGCASAPVLVRRAPYGRRRATVVLLAVIALFTLIELLSAAGSLSRVALGAFGGVPASASEGTSSAVSPGLTPVAVLPAASAVTVIVQPGDTVWSLAKRLQPEGDVRPLVQRIIDRNGGPNLRVGDRLVLER